MMDQELKRQILNNPKYRRAYMSKSLYRYCRYYFSNYYTFETPEFMLPIYKALEEGKNIFFEAFRYSAKTTLAQMYLNYAVGHKKRRHILWYSDTGEGSSDNLMYVANTFIENDRFIKDYGHLYYDENPTKFKSKTIKGKSKYITENECMLVGMSLGASTRGKNYTATDGKFRPDLIVFDDIDTSRSVRNKKMIDKNREFLTNEVFGGISAATQLIVLGNTIYEDGLVPRLREHFKDDKDWLIVRQPIYDDNGKIVRSRFVETTAEANELNKNIKNPHHMFVSLEKERERLGTISFGQNYLLIPYIKGMVIVSRHHINKVDCKDFHFDKIRIGLDTAISKSQESDRVAFTVTGYDGGKKYVCESLKLEGEHKRMPNQIKIAKDLYEKRGKQTDSIRMNVETVAFQEVLADYLKEEKLAVNPIKTHKDKVTRMLEYQGDFEAGNVFFNTTGCDDLIEELIAFPNGEYDDQVDSMMLSFDTKEESERVLESVY